MICKAALPSKEQHAADVYIAAMEVIDAKRVEEARTLVDKLRSVACAAKEDAVPSQESAYQQRKCRQLHRYPTTI